MYICSSMIKGSTYHSLLATFVEEYGRFERQGKQEDLDLHYPSCTDIRLAKSVSYPTSNGNWKVDLIVKPIPGKLDFRRQPLRTCRNEKEARILAAYTEKVMSSDALEDEIPFSSN